MVFHAQGTGKCCTVLAPAAPNRGTCSDWTGRAVWLRAVFLYNAAGCRIGMDDRRTNASKTLIHPHSYEGSNLFLAVDPCLRRNDGSVHR